MNAIIDQQTQSDLGAPKFQVGDRVRSLPIGARHGFVGTVEVVCGYVGQSCSGWTYNVRSDTGELWCRNDNDLTRSAVSHSAHSC